MDEGNNVIAAKSNIKENSITLTDLDLPTGDYGLEVWGESSSSYVEFSVVSEEKLPALYINILNSHVPVKIKRNYSVLVLASYPEWVFQSLQLSEKYGMDILNINSH